MLIDRCHEAMDARKRINVPEREHHLQGNQDVREQIDVGAGGDTRYVNVRLQLQVPEKRRVLR